MQRHVFIRFICLILISSTLLAEDRRQDNTRLVVMSINTYWMWDGVEPEEGRVKFSWKGNQEEAEKHMAEIAKIILRNNPDMISLSEIENLEALKTLNDKFLKGHGYKPYFAQGIDTYTGQDVGLLSRIDPQNEEIIRESRKGLYDETSKSVSKNYYARFNINGRKIALIGLHFLANPVSSTRGKDRQAQAAALQRRAIDLTKQGYGLIMLGDFNDFDSDVPDCKDSQPISKVMKIVKEVEESDTTDNLINVAKLLPKDQRYTIYYDVDRDNKIDPLKDHASIDHILISPSLEKNIKKVEIDHTVDVFKVTDHYPIVLELSLAP